MNDLKNNPKKFLKIQITNFARKLFTIFYLDELTRAIYHLSPLTTPSLVILTTFPSNGHSLKRTNSQTTISTPKSFPIQQPTSKSSTSTLTINNTQITKTITTLFKLLQDCCLQEMPTKSLLLLLII